MVTLKSKPRFIAWCRFLLPRIFYLRENLERRTLTTIYCRKGGFDLEKIYCYNTDSHTLHISGFCRDCEGFNIVDFETEEDVRAKYGLSVGFCRTCLGKREKVLEDYIKSKLKKGR